MSEIKIKRSLPMTHWATWTVQESYSLLKINDYLSNWTVGTLKSSSDVSKGQNWAVLVKNWTVLKDMYI